MNVSNRARTASTGRTGRSGPGSPGGPGTVSGVVGLRHLPEAVRALDTMDRPDYADLFTLSASGARDRSPEQWARAVLEETPAGRRARLLWRLLGLRLGPPHSPDHVQGWRIADGGEGWIRIETASWFATAHAVVLVNDEDVSVALFMRYDRVIAPLIWLPVSVMHQRGVPVLLHLAWKAQRPGRPNSPSPPA